MARLDIKSFQKGIELKKLQIEKLKEQIANLQRKIANTVECPQCHNHWDEVYLKKTYWQLEVPFDYDTYQEENQFAVCICPLCRKEFVQHISYRRIPLHKEDFKIGKFDIRLCNENELVRVKDMFEKYEFKSQNGQTELDEIEVRNGH
jgi:hypothetical protein